MRSSRACNLVPMALADKMLVPLLFRNVSVYIPLICFNFYQAVNLPQEGKIVLLINDLFWLLVGTSILASCYLDPMSAKSDMAWEEICFVVGCFVQSGLFLNFIIFLILLTCFWIPSIIVSFIFLLCLS